MTNGSAREVSIEPAKRAAHVTAFEDSNCYANAGSCNKVTAKGIGLPNINENLALLNNVSNGHSVPATVPASASHYASPIQAGVGGPVEGRDDRDSVAEYLTVLG